MHLADVVDGCRLHVDRGHHRTDSGEALSDIERDVDVRGGVRGRRGRSDHADHLERRAADLDVVTDGDLDRRRVRGVDNGDRGSGIRRFHRTPRIHRDGRQGSHRRDGRIDPEDGEGVDTERATAETSSSRGRVTLGSARRGSRSLAGRVVRARGQLAREAHVHQTQRAGGAGDTAHARDGVHVRGVQGPAAGLRRQSRLAERGSSVRIGRPGILIELEHAAAFAGLGGRTGHRQVRSDPVDGGESRVLRVSHPGERARAGDTCRTCFSFRRVLTRPSGRR